MGELYIEFSQRLSDQESYLSPIVFHTLITKKSCLYTLYSVVGRPQVALYQSVEEALIVLHKPYLY